MGTVVISVDAELGWGFHDLPVYPNRQLENAREGWRQLLELFERYEIPATWAVVGHLFLDDCEGHGEHPALPNWFECERSALDPDLRFGGTLIDDLLENPVDHEIACHSFSHVIFTDPRVTPEVARAELEWATAAAERHGVEFSSFVFPRNAVAHREVLAEHGFTAYRGQPRLSFAGSTASRLRPIRKIGAVLSRRPGLVEPRVDEYGLVDIGPSLYLFGFDGPGKSIVEPFLGDPSVQYAKRGIDATATQDGVFHMWLHPNNLVGPDEITRMETVLSYLREQADETDLQVRTMADVTTDYENAGPRSASASHHPQTSTREPRWTTR